MSLSSPHVEISLVKSSVPVDALRLPRRMIGHSAGTGSGNNSQGDHNNDGSDGQDLHGVSPSIAY